MLLVSSYEPVRGCVAARCGSSQYPQFDPCSPHSLQELSRGIEWSLRAFASMRAVRLFLRARAVINFIMRAVSTLEITNG